MTPALLTLRSIVKVNAEEVVSLAESGRDDGEGEGGGGVSVWMEDKLAMAAAELFVRHEGRLPWIAVTNGGLPSYVFSREFLGEDGSLSSFWRYFFLLPHGLPKGREGAGVSSITLDLCDA